MRSPRRAWAPGSGPARAPRWAGGCDGHTPCYDCPATRGLSLHPRRVSQSAASPVVSPPLPPKHGQEPGHEKPKQTKPRSAWMTNIQKTRIRATATTPHPDGRLVQTNDETPSLAGASVRTRRWRRLRARAPTPCQGHSSAGVSEPSRFSLLWQAVGDFSRARPRRALATAASLPRSPFAVEHGERPSCTCQPSSAETTATVSPIKESEEACWHPPWWVMGAESREASGRRTRYQVVVRKVSAHRRGDEAEPMAFYGGLCGWTLARAHARSESESPVKAAGGISSTIAGPFMSRSCRQ